MATPISQAAINAFVDALGHDLIMRSDALAALEAAAPHIAAAAAAAERERIRQLAIEHGAVCAVPQDSTAITGTAAAVWHDPPPLVLFAGLIEPAP